MPQVKHVYDTQVTQRMAPRNGLLPQGGGTEAAPTGGGGGAGGDRDKNNSIWDPPRLSHLLRLSWDIPLGIGQLLSSGGPQPFAGAADQAVEQGGRGCPELRENLCGGGSGGSFVWVGGGGYNTAHWGDYGLILSQGGP